MQCVSSCPHKDRGIRFVHVRLCTGRMQLSLCALQVFFFLAFITNSTAVVFTSHGAESWLFSPSCCSRQMELLACSLSLCILQQAGSSCCVSSRLLTSLNHQGHDSSEKNNNFSVFCLDPVGFISVHITRVFSTSASKNQHRQPDYQLPVVDSRGQQTARKLLVCSRAAFYLLLDFYEYK